MKRFTQLRWVAWITGVTIALTPLTIQPAHAQTAEQTFPLLNGIELTQPQKTQLAQVRTQTWQQIQAIVRPDQMDALRAAIGQGQKFRDALIAINLTPDQKSQLRQVLQSARTQASSILTPDQQQQLRQNFWQKVLQRSNNR